MTMRWRFIPLLLLLGACAAPDGAEVPERHHQSPARAELPQTLPPMKTFAPRPADMVVRANADILRDFLDLAFEMESGRPLPRLTRFEEPIDVAVIGGAPSTLGPDLDRLLARLRSEARIDIRRAETTATANILIETVPRRELQRAVPQAACFVVPRVAGWQDFLANRRSGALDWTTLERRTRTSVFIPSDVSPQEIRDCLHEEIGQALGPLNDLYRLPDSIFNDDNFHTVLTGFDMLVLRAFYAPEIRNGMTREAAARALPGLLARLNPAGERVAPEPLRRTPRAWIGAMETALGPRGSDARRRGAAEDALRIAASERWLDNRLGFSLFAYGRLALARDTEAALNAFARAHSLYIGLYGENDIHAAHVAMQMAAFALSSGQSRVVIDLIDRSLPAVMRAENAALLSTLLLIKAEALDLEGRGPEAAAVRLDSLGWARYGFGSTGEVRRRFAEITALTPERTQTGT